MSAAAALMNGTRKPSRRAWSIELALAVVLVAAWQQRLWLIVVSMAAAAITVVASEHLAEQTLAERAATWGLFAPTGIVDGGDVERAIAADVACVADGDLGVLDPGDEHLEQIRDPWLRGLAAERLQVARGLLEADDLPILRPRFASWLARREVLYALWASGASLVVAAMSTRQELVLVPLTLTVAVVATGNHEASRRTAAVNSVIRAPITAPVRGRALMPEPAVVAALASLTSGRPRVIARAHALVSTADAPRRKTALDRLAVSAQSAGRSRASGQRRISTWAAACCAGIALVELL